MRTAPPSVSVVIANWNGRHWLEQCLPALQAQTYRDFEVIVVDNGSDDGSVEWLGQNYPDIRILAQPGNLGFAQANNVAIRASTGKYIITLNNDTLVEGDWLANLVAAVSAPEVGMVACQITFGQQPEILDSAGLEVDRAGIAWNRGWGQQVDSATTACEVFGPSAAAALYRRAMLDEVGLFDEDFFAYYEDVDLAWRAQRAGWRCRYEPGARVRHWHSATSGKSPALKTYLLGRNKFWTIMKNYSWPALLYFLPAILFYDFIAVAFQITRGRDLSAVRGRMKALWSAQEALGKRRPGSPVKLAPLASPRRLLSGATIQTTRGKVV